MNWKKIIISTIVVGLVMLILAFVNTSTWAPILHPGMMDEYESSVYRSWEDPWMSYVFVHPFLVAFMMAITFSLFDPFKGKLCWKRGAKFGLLFWLITIVPGMLISYSSFVETVLSGTMILVWTIDGLIKYVIGGVVLAYKFECKCCK